MKTIKGMPITGGTAQYSKKAPFVPNAKDTSADAEEMIQEAPAPFKNRNQQGSMPAPSGASGGISTMEPRIASGLMNSTPGARALPGLGPVGQRKPINQSGQVNGRMGTKFPRKKGQNGQGFPTKKNASFYGE